MPSHNQEREKSLAPRPHHWGPRSVTAAFYSRDWAEVCLPWEGDCLWVFMTTSWQHLAQQGSMQFCERSQWKETQTGSLGFTDHLEYLFQTTLCNIHPIEAISHFKITCECVLVTCECARMQSSWAIPKGVGNRILIWCTPGFSFTFMGLISEQKFVF